MSRRQVQRCRPGPARPVRDGLWLCALVIALTAGAPVLGQETDCKPPRKSVSGALDEIAWKRLNAIYEKIGDGAYDEAYAELLALQEWAGKDTYLLALLGQALGQVELSRSNHEAARRHFETALDLDALPDQPHFALMYLVAQLYYMEDRLVDAMQRLEQWFCGTPDEKIPPAAWVLKASIHAREGDFAGALTAIDRAIAADPEPHEDWYRVKLAAQLELEQYSPAAKTLERLVAGWPDKPVYWTQLARIHQQLEQDGRALSVLALAHRRGLLGTQSDLIWLSWLYSHENIPYKAALVLEQGIREGIVEPSAAHWSQVADAWYAAGELEAALSAYAAAGAASGDGSVDLRRGYILVDLERWRDASEALTAALEKDGLEPRQAGQAYLLRGMAQFYLGHLDGAVADWNQAQGFEASREAATEWMNYLEEERLRRAS